jgi:hypothetical protein
MATKNSNRDNFDLSIVKAFADRNKLRISKSEASTGTKYYTFANDDSLFKLRVSKHKESTKEHTLLDCYDEVAASVDPTTHHSTYSIIYLLAIFFSIKLSEEDTKAKIKKQ